MMPASGSRDGFALPVALLAMIIIGAIVTGGFYASSQEARVSMSTELGAQAFYVAEYGLDQILASGRTADFNGVVAPEDWGGADVTTSTGQVLGHYDIEARSVGERLFLVTSTGTVSAGRDNASREVASIVRTARAELPRQSALSIFGGLTMHGNATEIDGFEQPEPGCPPIGAGVPGITTNRPDLIEATANLNGDPPIQEDPSLDVETLSTFGTLTLADLTEMADIVFEHGIPASQSPDPSTGAAGECNTADSLNWGDPLDGGVCGNRFPIIYAKDDVKITGGVGQGILIVDGDLDLAGNMQFFGVVVVTGKLWMGGTGQTGGQIVGTAIVHNGAELIDESTTVGNSMVQYSKCRVDRAFDAALRIRPLAARSWIDVSAAAPAALATGFPGG